LKFHTLIVIIKNIRILKFNQFNQIYKTGEKQSL
jgi:hypothetical protein